MLNVDCAKLQHNSASSTNAIEKVKCQKLNVSIKIQQNSAPTATLGCLLAKVKSQMSNVCCAKIQQNSHS